MKNPRTIRVVVIAFIALFAVAGGVWQARSSRASVQTSSSAPVVAATVAVERAPVTNTLTIAGEFLPWQEVELHAKVAGYIKKINVDIGDRVHAGQVLAELEIPELNAQVLGADAGVRHSQDDVTRAAHALDRARAEHESLHNAAVRLQQASQARPGLIAQQELDYAIAKDRTSEAQIEEAEATLSGSRQQVDVSRAAHSQVSAMQEYSHIVAPFDGIVTWRFADVGALIQAGTSNSSSMPVVKLADVNTLRLRIPVPEVLASNIRVGASAGIRVQATGQQIGGKVARFTGSFDRATRTMQVEIDVPNHEKALAPGMYADVVLETDEHPDALTLPVQAIKQSNTRTTVLLVGPNNKVQVRDIRVGIQTANRVEVLAGLAEGDRVIVGNLGTYQEGEVVSPRPSSLVTAKASEGGER